MGGLVGTRVGAGVGQAGTAQFLVSTVCGHLPPLTDVTALVFCVLSGVWPAGVHFCAHADHALHASTSQSGHRCGLHFALSVSRGHALPPTGLIAIVLLRRVDPPPQFSEHGPQAPQLETLQSTFVGAGVGGCVGPRVGRYEGVGVGMDVGGWVGVGVGTALGGQVGEGLVGGRVGYGVGSLLGGLVGSSDGFLVGGRVGSCVGDGVGARVGTRVGTIVGKRVGRLVVGCRVGARVGLTVGGLVGTGVGSLVGGRVGDLDGDRVGERVQGWRLQISVSFFLGHFLPPCLGSVSVRVLVRLPPPQGFEHLLQAFQFLILQSTGHSFVLQTFRSIRSGQLA